MFTRNCVQTFTAVSFIILEVVLEAALGSTRAIVGGDQWAERGQRSAVLGELGFPC